MSQRMDVHGSSNLFSYTVTLLKESGTQHHLVRHDQIKQDKTKQPTAHTRVLKEAKRKTFPSTSIFHPSPLPHSQTLITTLTPNPLASLTQHAKHVLPTLPTTAFSPTFAHHARARSSRSALPRQSSTATSSSSSPASACWSGRERARDRASSAAPAERRVATGRVMKW